MAQSGPPRAGEVLRFLLSGGANTALTYAIYLLATLVLGYQAAYAIAYVAGIGISYWFNSRFVFRQPGSWAKLLRYPLVYLAQYACGAVLLEGLVRWLAVPSRLAPLVVVVLTLPLTYLLSRRILARGNQG